MNDRLVFNGHSALTKEEFLAKVNSSDTNVSEFAFGDDEPTEPNTGDNAEPRWKPARWKPWPRETLIDQAVRYKVNEPHGNLGRRAFEDLNFRLDQARQVDPLSYDPITLEEFNKLVENAQKIKMSTPRPEVPTEKEEVWWNTGSRF